MVAPRTARLDTAAGHVDQAIDEARHLKGGGICVVLKAGRVSAVEVGVAHRRGAPLWIVVALVGGGRDAGATSSCDPIAYTGCTFPNISATPTSTVDVTATFTVNCTTNDTPITLTASAGAGTEANRRFGGAATFNYQMYTDAARTNYLGTTAGHILTIASPVIGNNTFTYYCRIFSGQTPPSGGYTDPPIFWGFHFPANTASVNGTASVSVTTQLAFGAYDPVSTHASTPKDGTAVVRVTATNGMLYTMTAGQGLNPANGSNNDVPLRQMADGTKRLRYDFYSDSGRTIILGNSAATGKVHVGGGGGQNLTIYGRIPAAQTSAAGTYGDTVLITVTF